MSADTNKLENSDFYDTTSPDLEKHPRQTSHASDSDGWHSQPQIRQVHTTKEKTNVKEKRMQESLMMEYGEKQDRALYQPMCG